MATAWFLMPYRAVDIGGGLYGRQLALYSAPGVLAAYRANGGRLASAPSIGNHAVVKVNGPRPLLDAIGNIAGVDEFPVGQIDSELRDLTPGQKQYLRDKVVSLGYSLAEVQARFGNDLGDYTLRDLVRFILRRGNWEFTVNPDLTLNVAGSPTLGDGALVVDQLDARA